MVGYIAQEHVHHPPVQKLLVVPVSPDEAFRRFAAIGNWWPLATHAVAMGEALSAEIEGHVGGRVLERGRDGSERCVGDGDSVDGAESPLDELASRTGSGNRAGPRRRFQRG